MPAVIDRFDGPYRFLSNFYPAPVHWGSLWFATVEHGYQAAKCRTYKDRVPFTTIVSPGAAKRRGRIVHLRPDWDSVKLKVMAYLLRQKFTPGSPLAQSLLQTGEAELIEGNTWNDRYWGVCGGVGENHLGRLLMQVRSELKKGNV